MPPSSFAREAFTLPSITSWTRLEVQCRDPQMEATLEARLWDPLWLLTRQWQMGEFQAEDRGAPVLATIRATTALLSRIRLGDLQADTQATADFYDPLATPLADRISYFGRGSKGVAFGLPLFRRCGLILLENS